MKKSKGVIFIELLISGMILALSIAAAMYLMRLGYQFFAKYEDKYLIYMNIPLAYNLIKVSKDKEGKQTLNGGVMMEWKSKSLGKTILQLKDDRQDIRHAVELFRINLILKRNSESKEIELYILKNEKIN